LRPDIKRMSDSELMQVAADREMLSADVAVAIDAELSRRGLSITTAKKQALREERKGTRRSIGDLGFSRRGWGKHFFGVSRYQRDAAALTEQFDSTLWIWIAWLPVVPIASYHIERHECGKSPFWSLSKPSFAASNEAPPFVQHVIFGWAFTAVAAVVAFRILVAVLTVFR
jgi:hypothetical protein